MDKFIQIILIITIPLLIFYALNTWTLFKIFKRPLRQDNLNDSKYFELKYKQEFFTGMFLVISSTISILGYNFIQDIKETIKKETKEDLKGIRDSIGTYKKDIGTLKQDAKHLATWNQAIATTLANQQITANSNEKLLISLSRQLNNTDRIIKEINSRPILEKDFYIIKDGVILNGDSMSMTVFFNNLKTIQGDRLPEFSKPPLIQAFSNDGGDCSVIDVKTSSFVVFQSGGSFLKEPIPKEFRLTLIITEDK